MKKFTACFALFAAAAAVFITGCETESADELSISVNPSYANLRVGQSVTLTASGGWNYRWSCGDGGALSANAGEKVVYTALESGKTVTVTVTGMGGTSSNSAPYQATAKMIAAGDAKSSGSSSAGKTE